MVTGELAPQADWWESGLSLTRGGYTDLVAAILILVFGFDYQSYEQILKPHHTSQGDMLQARLERFG